MGYTGETDIIFKGKTICMKVVQDADYLLGLMKTDDDVSFWAVLWPAAVAMSEYFWENIDFQGQRVLELGAGLGLAGIVAAVRNADLVQTDFIPEALALAQENARCNGINNISYMLADWREFSISERFHWIIGSDILYEPNLYPFLKKIFRENLMPGGSVILSDPGRADAQRFIEELRRDGYDIKTVVKEIFEAGRRIQVSIYFLKY